MRWYPLCLPLALSLGLVACATAPSSAASPGSDTRAAFLKLIDRPQVPPAVKIVDTGTSAGVAHARFTYTSYPGMRVPSILARPAQRAGRLPVVIMLHGTGGKKEDMKAQMELYAQAGFLAVAIDGPFHGERANFDNPSSKIKNAGYQEAILSAWRHPGSAHPLFYDTVWDVMRLVDYLQTRDDVDPARIGLMGVSKGGIETYLTTAADPRIAVAVPFISLESFHYSLDHNLWSHRTETFPDALNSAAGDLGIAPAAVDAAFVRKFYDKVAPGIYGQFDGPSMITLIAPRPLLAINGEKDLRTPRPGVDECLDNAQPLYHAAQADDHLRYIAEPNTAHAVTPESYRIALDWFKQWLKP